MKRVLYTSRATRPLTVAELSELIARAEAHNATVGITGLLIAYNGSYMQLLEGPEEAVDDVYDRITRDPRHTHVVLRDSGPIEERRCSGWGMGLSVPDDVAWAARVRAAMLPTPPVSLDLMESALMANTLMEHVVQHVEGAGDDGREHPAA